MARGRKPKFTQDQIDRDKQRIVSALEDLGSYRSFKDIAEFISKDMYDLRWALNALLEDGRIVCIGKKRAAKYILVAEGMEIPRTDEDEVETVAINYSNFTNQEIVLQFMKDGRTYQVPELSTMLGECRPNLRLDERSAVLSHMVKIGQLTAGRVYEDGYRMILTKVA